MRLKYSIIISFAFLMHLLVGCSTIKPKNASKGGKKLFETFYLGEKGTQYFIKPLLFENENSKLSIDLTVRESSDTTIMNFSLLELNQTKELSPLEIASANKSTEATNIKSLFTEREKEGIVSRYSSEVSSKDLKKIFKSPDWKITINNSKVFKPTNRTMKQISELNAHIFSIAKIN